MAGTLEKITAFHQQIFSSNKYAFINSVIYIKIRNKGTNKQNKKKITNETFIP